MQSLTYWYKSFTYCYKNDKEFKSTVDTYFSPQLINGIIERENKSYRTHGDAWEPDDTESLKEIFNHYVESYKEIDVYLDRYDYPSAKKERKKQELKDVAKKMLDILLRLNALGVEATVEEIEQGFKLDKKVG